MIHRINNLMCFNTIMLLVLYPVVGMVAPVYQCEGELGQTHYQESPCEGKTLKVINDIEEKHTVLFTQAMKQTLAKLTQKTTVEYNDSTKVKAIEVLAMVDAAKSYAFTQIYAVSVKRCGPDVETKLIDYKNQASEVIALGAYYYSQGIDAKVDGKDFSQSGEKLHAALDKMTQKIDREHRSANESQLVGKCKEASQALATLSMLYAN